MTSSRTTDEFKTAFAAGMKLNANAKDLEQFKKYMQFDLQKNLKPLVKRQIKKKTVRLKPMTPLVIVNTLKGKGVKPAKNIIPSQVKKPPLVDILS